MEDHAWLEESWQHKWKPFYFASVFWIHGRHGATLESPPYSRDLLLKVMGPLPLPHPTYAPKEAFYNIKFISDLVEWVRSAPQGSERGPRALEHGPGRRGETLDRCNAATKHWGKDAELEDLKTTRGSGNVRNR